jgi:hypothetical protein
VSHYGNSVLPVLMQCECEGHAPAPLRPVRIAQPDDPDGRLRFDIARVAEACACRGRHPENQAALERVLLAAAELEPLAERNEMQSELRFAA